LSSPFAKHFTRADCKAWSIPDRLGPAEWAEKYRILVKAAEPGPYRLERTPYLREIHEALGDVDFDEVVVVKPAQTGGSECGRNWLGWICDMSPADILLVFPSEDSCKEQMRDRIIPMFGNTPRLAALKTGRMWDMKAGQVTLSSCCIYPGWAGSPQALASRPICFILADEVDKWVQYTGREADPMSLARARMKTYGHRAKIFTVSTPTVPTGPIMRSYDACVDRREYHVPCPGCGAFHLLEWANVKWEGQEASDEVALLKQAGEMEADIIDVRYVCPNCEHETRESERWEMVTAGEWVSDGCPRGERPPGRSVGFKISGLSPPAPWTSLTKLALDYTKARLKGISELHHFHNSTLGEAFWGLRPKGEGLCEIHAERIWSKRAAGHKRLELPPYATVVIAAADTGRKEHPWGIRAFGEDFRSRLLDYGVAKSFDELRASTIGRKFGGISVQRLYIDAGGGKAGGEADTSLTDTVYRLAQLDPGRIFPLRGVGGSSRPLSPVTTRRYTYHPPRENSKPYDVTMSMIDVTYFKDITAGRINNEDEGLWEIYDEVSSDYVMQVCAERKILVERRITPQGEDREIFRWIPRAVGSPNHFFDVECYLSLGAYMLDVHSRSQVESNQTGYARATEGRGGGWQIGR